ncbi:MAG: hypothetical protein ACKVQB_01980 [Bacteroidia bacterium]
MRKQLITRKYRYSDAGLVQKTEDIINCAKRDETDLALYGLTSAFITTVEDAKNNVIKLANDSELLSEVMTATQNKNEKREEVRRQIRQMASRAATRFGDSDIRYRIYGIGGLSSMTDNDLVRTAREVVRLASLQIAELAEEGLTELVITKLESDTIALDKLIDLKIIAVKNRDIAVEERVIAGNYLFSIITVVAAKGKLCWVHENPAKFSNYILNEKAKNNLQTTEGTIETKMMVNISAFINKPGSKLNLINLGIGPLLFYYATDPIAYPETRFTTIPPGQSKVVSAAVLGFQSGKKERLIAYNPGTQNGSYRVQWE